MGDDGGSSFIQVITLWWSEVHCCDVSGANPVLENVEGGFAQHVLWFEDLVRVFVGSLEEFVENVAVVLGDEESVAGYGLV